MKIHYTTRRTTKDSNNKRKKAKETKEKINVKGRTKRAWNRWRV